MNPNYNPQTGPNGQTNPMSLQNQEKPFVPRSHNYFPDMSHGHYKTFAYGQVEPFFCEPVVPGDRLKLKNKLSLQSNPMISPFMSDIRVKKINTYVPMQAILPFGWEYLYQNPARGDDVVFNEVNTILTNFTNGLLSYAVTVKSIVNDLTKSYSSSVVGTSDILSRWRKAIIAVTMFDNLFSSGSLLSSLGYKQPIGIYNVPYNITIDDVINSLWDFIIPDGLRFTATQVFDNQTIGVTYEVASDSVVDKPNRSWVLLSKRGARDVLMSFLDRIQSISLFSNQTDSSNSWISLDISNFLFGKAQYVLNGSQKQLPFNYSALVAYQLSCAQFFVNPKVDYVNTAELWRQSFKTLVESVTDIASYTYNGMTIQYDYVSGYYVQKIFDIFVTAGYTKSLAAVYDVSIPLLALFSYDRALRYGDYFTGSRTQPYGVDTESKMLAPVTGSGVSAIDVTRSIIYQRFYNLVAKIGNSVDDYRKALTGKLTPPDYHYPRFISADDTSIETYTIQNNSSVDTGNLVSRVSDTELKKYEYTLDIDLHGYVLGMIYFYIPRSYSSVKRRHFFHEDRFDIFNEMIQNIGDQPVYGAEISSNAPEIFSYQGRNEEYKQQVSLVTGAFTGPLRSWVFTNENFGSPSYGTLFFPLNPDTIRSYPSELDYIFQNPVGMSNSLVYHFIGHIHNDVDFVRPMIKSPNIL